MFPVDERIFPESALESPGPMDSVALYGAVRELAAALAGGQVRRIQQMARDLFVFTLWVPPERRFLISLAPRAARIHLAAGEYGAATTPSAFCMLLRKHLEGARLERAATLGLDRVVRLDFCRAEERCSLIVELLPTGRTMALLDAGDRVLADLVRARRRGEIWRPAPPPRPDALTLPGVDLAAGAEDAPLERAIPRACFGIGARHARPIARAAGLDPLIAAATLTPRQRADLAAAWDAYWDRVRNGDPEGLGARLERAYGSGSAEPGLERERERLQSLVQRHRERTERRRQAQQADLERAADADRWRHLGDLLTANLHRVARRAASVTVDDFSRPDAPPVAIELDPERTPQENAQQYYARYKKARRAQDAVAQALARTDEDLAYLDAMHVSVQTSQTRDDLRDLAGELRAEDVLERSRAPAAGRARGPAARPRRWQGAGWDILVGRNPRQNEVLTMKLARPDDLWLHARQIPGAHVLLRRRDARGEPTDGVLLAAATLAARFSRGAEDTRVAVDCTPARYVKKPPGTPAGYVTYRRERTITVDPRGAEALADFRAVAP